MESKIRQRLHWVEEYRASGNAGLTCLRCGISRPTLRKWVRRYEQFGLEGLADQSRRPLHSPARKVFAEQEQWILALRNERKLGVRCIQHELERLHECHLAIATIADVLVKHKVSQLDSAKRRHPFKRYAKAIPGERVQMDTMKVAPGIYQYTAIDDCSRFVVAELYSRRTAANTLAFLEFVLDAFAVPVQCIQTDRGAEFMAMKVQYYLRELHIKYRPIRPASPHLNGKVERVQQTIWRELYATTDLKSNDLADQLGVWVTYYNYQRIHSSLGTTPAHRFCEHIQEAPYWDDVFDAYDLSTERFRERNYADDLRLGQIRPSRQPCPSQR